MLYAYAAFGNYAPAQVEKSSPPELIKFLIQICLGLKLTDKKSNCR